MSEMNMNGIFTVPPDQDFDTVTFQGYAYGTNSMYDEINLSNTGTCKD